MSFTKVASVISKAESEPHASTSTDPSGSSPHRSSEPIGSVLPTTPG